MGVEIRLLGGFQAVVDGEPVPDRAWRLRKARTLVKLLALAPRRSLHRDQVLELLWSDRPPHRAANNLHQAVHAARRALGAEVIEVRDELLTLAGPVTVDVDGFEQAATRARKTGARQDYTTALDCWSGELLPEDLYETWTEPRRATLRDEHSSLCLELGEWHLQDGEFDAGLKRARSVLLDEPLHEPAHRLVMRAYVGAGRRQDALAQFEHLRDALRSDLAAEPDATTRALYRQLLASQGAEDPSPEALHLLPVQLTSFLGRDQEIVELGRLLTRERLVTLTGAGGVGKTRLALAGAAAGLERFPDGAWFIDLGSLTDPALVAEQAAVTVGLRVPAQRSAAEALAAHLTDRAALLILDTCEHVIDAAAVLAEQLVAHCAKLTILATSREPLRCRGEHNWRVPGLGLASPDDETDAIARAPAVGLFVARAVEADPTFELNDENARDIALATRRLDGIPLAIELAAARLSVLSPAQIATRLESSLDVLGTGARTALTRQQTLRATIAWSYNLLSEEEREVFRRLSVFAGSFPVEAAEIVSSGGAIEQRAVLDVLARLVSKSLVMVEDAAAARYRLLDTIRQYGAELLDSTGERREAEASHRRWVVGLTEEPVAAGGADSVRLELDHDNIRTALATGLADEPEAALRITAAVWRLWLDLSYYTEGARQVEAVLAANPSPSALRARVLLAAAALGVRLGDPDGSVASAREAEAVARAVGDPLLLADVLHAVHIQLAPAVFLLGSVEDMRPAFAESEAPLAEAIELAEACGAHHIVASALHASSLMYLHRGDVDGARRAVDLSLERLSRVPADAPPFFEGVTAGFPVLPEGPGGRPRPLFEQTIFLFHRFGRAQAIAHALANLAVISRMQGREVEARELLEDALARFRSAGDSAGEALALMGLGNWARTFGQPDAAYAYLDESLSLQRRGSDRRAASLTECDLALALAAGGEHERARALFGPLRERFRLADDEPALAGLLLNWGAAEEWAGELDRAAELLEEGTRSWWERTGGTSAGWAWLALADVLRAAGSAERADEVLRRARTILERVGDARGVAACDVHRWKPCLADDVDPRHETG